MFLVWIDMEWCLIYNLVNLFNQFNGVNKMGTLKTIKEIIPKPCNCIAGKWEYIETPSNFFEAYKCQKHGYILKIRTILFNTLSLNKLS